MRTPKDVPRGESFKKRMDLIEAISGATGVSYADAELLDAFYRKFYGPRLDLLHTDEYVATVKRDLELGIASVDSVRRLDREEKL